MSNQILATLISREIQRHCVKACKFLTVVRETRKRWITKFILAERKKIFRKETDRRPGRMMMYGCVPCAMSMMEKLLRLFSFARPPIYRRRPFPRENDICYHIIIWTNEPRPCWPHQKFLNRLLCSCRCLLWLGAQVSCCASSVNLLRRMSNVVGPSGGQISRRASLRLRATDFNWPWRIIFIEIRSGWVFLFRCQCHLTISKVFLPVRTLFRCMLRSSFYFFEKDPRRVN